MRVSRATARDTRFPRSATYGAGSGSVTERKPSQTRLCCSSFSPLSLRASSCVEKEVQQLFLPLSREEPFLGCPLKKVKTVLPGSCVSRIPSNWFFPEGKNGHVSAQGIKVGEKEKATGKKKAICFVVHMALDPRFGTSSTIHAIDFFLETLKFDLRDRQLQRRPGSRWRGSSAHATRAFLSRGCKINVLTRRKAE